MKFTKIIFLIFFIIILCACNKEIPVSYKNYKTYNTQKVESIDYKTFHGFIKSQMISKLSFQTEGKIIFLPYTKGDFVKKGQVLARLDGILYKIKRNEEQQALQNATIQYNKAKSYYRRMDILHKEGAISDNDWEEAYFDLKSNAQVMDIQKEKIRYLDKEISYNIITAPFDGFVSDKLSEVGSYAQIGQPVLTICAGNKTQIETMVDSSVINRLNLNDNVVVKRNDETYKGKIAHISKSSLQEGGYLVKIYLETLVDSLKDGMSVEVEIPFLNSNVVYIPLDAFFEQNHQKYVYKLVNIKDNFGQVKKEKVTLGQIKNDKIEVLEGLSKDDIIVLDELDKVEDNEKIRI